MSKTKVSLKIFQFILLEKSFQEIGRKFRADKLNEKNSCFKIPHLYYKCLDTWPLLITLHCSDTAKKWRCIVDEITVPVNICIRTPSQGDMGKIGAFLGLTTDFFCLS